MRNFIEILVCFACIIALILALPWLALLFIHYTEWVWGR